MISFIGILDCFISERFLIVTVLLSKVSKSTVIANGIPSSSVQEYLLPIEFPPQSVLHYILAAFKLLSISFTLLINVSFLIKLKITHLKGAMQNGSYKYVLYISVYSVAIFHILKVCSKRQYIIHVIPKEGSIIFGINFSS